VKKLANVIRGPKSLKIAGKQRHVSLSVSNIGQEKEMENTK